MRQDGHQRRWATSPVCKGVHQNHRRGYYSTSASVVEEGAEAASKSTFLFSETARKSMMACIRLLDQMPRSIEMELNQIGQCMISGNPGLREHAPMSAVRSNSENIYSLRVLPPVCRVSDTGPLMIYPPVLMAGVRKPSGKEPAGGGVGGLLSMGICRGSVLGRGCTGRRNGRRTDDRGRDFVAAPAVGGVFLA